MTQSCLQQTADCPDVSGLAGWRQRARRLLLPTAATTAATKNSEQKIRRHFDGVNVDLEFGFVIIELPVRLVGCW